MGYAEFPSGVILERNERKDRVHPSLSYGLLPR